MDITDYCDAINKDLVVRYYHLQDRWTVSIVGAEVKKTKDDNMSASVYGESHQIIPAINDYIEKIRGTTLVFNTGTTKERRMFEVPELEKAL